MVDFERYKNDGLVPYFRVTQNGDKTVKVWAGPPGLAFPEIKKGQPISEGVIYSAAKIDRIYIPK